MESKKSFNLLWPEGFQSSETPLARDLRQKLIEDLDLKNIFRIMNLNLRTTSDTFDPGDVLDKFTTESEVIKYRLEILEDILDNPDLYQTLENLLPKIEEMGRLSFSQSSNTSRLKKVVTQIGKLELFVEGIESIKKFFSGAEKKIKSRGLSNFKAKVKEITSQELYQSLKKELPKMKKQFEGLKSVTLGINLDAQLRPQEAVLVSINDQVYQEGNILDKLLNRDSGVNNFKGISSLEVVSRDINGEQVRFLNRSLMQELEKVMKSVIRSVGPKVTKYMKNNTRFLINLKPALRFYLGAVKLVEKIESLGLPMCKPEIAPRKKRALKIENNYNLNLALQLAGNESEIKKLVKNEVDFKEQGRVYILTGPNRGGKTTYLQAVGISQLLFQLGLYVPGSQAYISPCDNILTHFPTEERLKSNLGRLGEECNRLKNIFNQASKYSLILLNESLASTSPREGLYIANEIISSLKILGARVIFVTHFHELATDLEEINSEIPGAAQIKSLVAGVKEKEDGFPERTYKIKQRKPLGSSYARNIADNLGISIEKITTNLKEKGKISSEIDVEAIKQDTGNKD